MAKDFRKYLVEASRHEMFGRFFKELQIGLKIVASFQASATHASEPAETLDDMEAYTKWEVSLRQVNKPITVVHIGAWTHLQNQDWAKSFDKPEFQNCVTAEFLSVEEAQKCFDAVIEYAMANDQLDSEDDIRVVEPDENLKKAGGCGGCASKKKTEPATAK
ncbi:hypothetical protein [Pseudodesulfovibrio piezophilus]|uniref:Uncharacterized protein n=1 Tax=Pseudodesulfovibrio piezophilus (strain DSM 21447 / JCM 15486 / C1TLV30) TaxID=1322246 RepID=M1WTS0_PSEP2|nr:hypothetical protein [Pseudodesulfovibrio piezophilus]CCH49847.1 conserved protein of unknown function [Pseudodesulfovibrio piezophilus C1TLV30]